MDEECENCLLVEALRKELEACCADLANTQALYEQCRAERDELKAERVRAIDGMRRMMTICEIDE